MTWGYHTSMPAASNHRRNNMNTTYRGITVQLSDTDGNAFALVGTVKRALKDGGVPASEITEFCNEAMSAGSYDDLLRFLMETVYVS